MPFFGRKKSPYDEYPDDVFKDSRMSIGDHLDELRMRMINALKYLLLFMSIGFALDYLGYLLKNPNIGVGKVMLNIITDPMEEQVRDFYSRRIERLKVEKLNNGVGNTPAEEIARIQEKLKEAKYNLTELTSDERRKLLESTTPMPVTIPTKSLGDAFVLKPDAPEHITLELQVYPAHLSYIATKGEHLIGFKQYLSTMSAQEAFITYFKVAIICGIVLGSPFILYQFWAFVGAGLYPHEKKYVYLFFGPSVGLFLAGVILCQFFVLPGAIKALIVFNEWLGIDLDIRLKEWLSLALLLPLVFGVSFQTPLVMVFMNRIGLFTAKDYLAKWKYACFIIVVFAAIATPSPDAITMLYLFIPMFGLYMAGIVVCHYLPNSEEVVESESAEEVAV